MRFYHPCLKGLGGSEHFRTWQIVTKLVLMDRQRSVNIWPFCQQGISPSLVRGLSLSRLFEPVLEERPMGYLHAPRKYQGNTVEELAFFPVFGNPRVGNHGIGGSIQRACQKEGIFSGSLGVQQEQRTWFSPTGVVKYTMGFPD